MSTTSERAPFVEAEFIEDLEKGAADIGSPFSEAVVRDIINAFGESIHEAALQIRTGDKSGLPIVFRLLFGIPLDAVDVALKQGWVDERDPMVDIHRSLKMLAPTTIDQPEFTIGGGFDAMFLNLVKLTPITQLLASPALPACVKAKQSTFDALGLSEVIVCHLEYKKNRIGFYFLLNGPLTKEKLTREVALAGAPEPSDEVYHDLTGVLLDSPYYLTVVLDCDTGDVVRIEYHLFFPIKLPDEMRIPEVGERLTSFWDIPSHEYEEMDILAYGFGDTSNGSIVALRSYCGGLRTMMRSWNIVGA